MAAQSSRRWRSPEEEEEEEHGPRLCTKTIQKLCVKHNLYRTPHLNESLYLHYEGFRKIEGLEEYTEARVLWLQGNAITKIENLEPCAHLRCLYLQDNAIDKIENLNFPEMDTINLTNNQIRTIENLRPMAMLHTLTLVNNNIESAEACRGLLDAPSIGVLDLSNNRIPVEDAQALLDILAQMPALAVLRLVGNPVVRSQAFHYRKTYIVRCKRLTYLDERPVFDGERLCSEAWGRGATPQEAIQLEQAERQRQRDEQEAKDDRNREAMRMLMEEGYTRRIMREEEEARQAAAAATAATTPVASSSPVPASVTPQPQPAPSADAPLAPAPGAAPGAGPEEEGEEGIPGLDQVSEAELAMIARQHQAAAAAAAVPHRTRSPARVIAECRDWAGDGCRVPEPAAPHSLLDDQLLSTESLGPFDARPPRPAERPRVLTSNGPATTTATARQHHEEGPEEADGQPAPAGGAEKEPVKAPSPAQLVSGSLGAPSSGQPSPVHHTPPTHTPPITIPPPTGSSTPITAGPVSPSGPEGDLGDFFEGFADTTTSYFSQVSTQDLCARVYARLAVLIFFAPDSLHHGWMLVCFSVRGDITACYPPPHDAATSPRSFSHSQQPLLAMQPGPLPAVQRLAPANPAVRRLLV
ncbi:putative outer arm dynein light chain 1 [Paratrimastix pyriformis]|uniref:Outer arm dynein light chain 1 n=1 Tax=Paratrimastix pyriformis TaxID=342808 RepID=A0ABQ8UEB2_9EUKA|nr:putative outer arm dynein light chain 1 [Paratrimastix pyriformis]